MKLERTNEEWEAEKRFYKGIYASKLDRETKIIEITNSDELGFTGKDETIHLAKDHKMMEKMSEGEKRAFRAGVFCHEMLHQIYTDFGYLDKIMEESDKKDHSVLMLMINLIEDPAIEHFAPEVVGGTLLKSLNFTIKTIYDQSPPIDEQSDSFSQVINALIQFGDMGLIKGSLNEEALEYFRKIAPGFNEGIKCPSSKKRMEMAKEWVEITRPLWEKDDNIDETCNKLMTDNSISSTSGDPSQGHETPDTTDSPQDNLSNKRDTFLDKLEKNEELAAAEEETESPINASDIEELLNHIYDNMTEYEKNLHDKRRPSAIPDIKMPEYSSVKGKVNRIQSDDIASYNTLRNNVSKDIKILVKSMRNIFRNEIDEEIRATSGSYNIQRDIKRNTVKIFDKRKERDKIDDMAVMLIVDESGSMNGFRMEHARYAAIMLTEAFSILNIPCYVIGFTADMDGCDVIHNHYVTWSNLAKERISLNLMSAKANNFDAYSIRYAGRILQQKKAEKKLMFVISDGLPNCRHCAGRPGIDDTAKAIREISKKAKVLGIGIGGNNSTFDKMYNGSFVHTSPERLSLEIIKQLKRICT